STDGLENIPRFRPSTLPCERDRTPDRRVLLIADLRFGELLESVVWTIKHDVGDSLEHAAGHVFRCALVGERDVENGLGLGGHLFRKIKARKIETRLPPLAYRGRCGEPDQLGLTGIEWRIAIEAPDLGIKREGAKADRDLLLAESCRRQGQSRRPADRDLVDAKLCRDVIRDRLNNDTVDGGQRAQFDKILHLEKAAYRSERRDNQQPVVDIRIFDSVNGARAVKRNSDACAILAYNASRDRKRRRLCRRRVGNIDNPGRTVGFEARHARTCKLDAHDPHAILSTLKKYFPHALVIVRLKCSQIDLRGA